MYSAIVNDVRGVSGVGTVASKMATISLSSTGTRGNINVLFSFLVYFISGPGVRGD